MSASYLAPAGTPKTQIRTTNRSFTFAWCCGFRNLNHYFPQVPRPMVLYQEIQSQTQTSALSKCIIPPDCEPLALSTGCLTVAEAVRRVDPSPTPPHPTPSLPLFSPSLTWLCPQLSFLGISTTQASDKAAPFFHLLYLKHLTCHICDSSSSRVFFWTRNIVPRHGRGQEDKTLGMLSPPHFPLFFTSYKQKMVLQSHK